MVKDYLKGIGMLAGMIFGAGVFALPFAIARAGIFWGIFHFFLALALMIFFHILYGEIAYVSGEDRRFTGYAEKYLGLKAKWLAFLATIFTDYGSLLVYGILGGIFLSNFFGLSPFILSLVFFAIGGLLIFAHFEKIAGLNFFLTAGLAGLVVYLLIIALPHIETGNFLINLNFSFSSGWLLPYGIWIFSLAGFSALPEVRDIICPPGMTAQGPLKKYKRIILASLILCAILYVIFIFTVVGVSGLNTSPDSLSGLVNALGRPGIIAGSILGFLAVFTSFTALGADLKNVFHLDFNLPSWLAWLAVVIPPIILFAWGLKNFTEILGFIGTIGLGFFGILIVLMARKLPYHKNSGKFIFAGCISIVLIIAAIIASLI